VDGSTGISSCYPPAGAYRNWRSASVLVRNPLAHRMNRWPIQHCLICEPASAHRLRNKGRDRRGCTPGRRRGKLSSNLSGAMSQRRLADPLEFLQFGFRPRLRGRFFARRLRPGFLATTFASDRCDDAHGLRADSDEPCWRLIESRGCCHLQTHEDES